MDAFELDQAFLYLIRTNFRLYQVSRTGPESIFSSVLIQFIFFAGRTARLFETKKIPLRRQG